MIVWRVRGKIIRIVPCCVVYDSCAQWYAHTYQPFFNMIVDLRFSFCAFVLVWHFVFFLFSLNYFFLVLFACVVLGLVFSADWLERTSPK